MKLLQHALCLLVLTACVQQISAQQVEEFSLLRENAFTLNPALAGMNGWLHGTATFRKQFTRIDQSPYTAMLSMDGQIDGKNIGIGGYLIHDVTGPTGKSAATVAVAYNIPLYKKYSARYSNGTSKHNLSIGLSLSAVQYRLRGDQLAVNDPNDPGLYTTKGWKFFPDASFGIYYRYKQNFYVGVSVPQILGLNVNYRGNDGFAAIKKMQHVNVLLGGKIEWARGNFSIDPVASFRWVKGAPPQGDVGLRFNMYKIFWLGANYRSLNYAIFEAGFNVKNNFFLSYAYDFNFSKYRRDMGATHEISLSFRIEKKSRIWRGTGPALRF
ncbi:MAG: PorP/SprF family type IX secretion system membrane protein [Chitinophagales bacterium]